MRTALLAVTIMCVITTIPLQKKTMKIQFLGMRDGCPNTPKMWTSLHEALQELNWTIHVDWVDVVDLSREQDPRAGYGAPTILFNGMDLFGTEPEKSLDPSCRFYPGGVPTTQHIVARLRALAK